MEKEEPMPPLAPAHAACLSHVEDLHREAAARRMATEFEPLRRRRLRLAARLRADVLDTPRLAFATAHPAPHH